MEEDELAQCSQRNEHFSTLDTLCEILLCCHPYAGSMYVIKVLRKIRYAIQVELAREKKKVVDEEEEYRVHC
jgi:hypothetical protein